MKLKKLYIKNFRCYKDQISVEFENLTTFIGKNDIGKSTILDALEIFFNNETVKIDSNDPNVYSKSSLVSITCDFVDLPDELILDSGEKTNLSKEFLTFKKDTIRIKKIFDCGKSKPSEEIFIVANHPNATGVNDLFLLKEKELQERVKEKGLDGPLKGNPSMRSALWNSTKDLSIKETDISISKSKEDVRNLWRKLESYLPTFALFQNDRSSQDSDGEVQNPMKIAIQEAIKEVQKDIDNIQQKVRQKALEIADRTQKALIDIDENLANQLNPNFSAPSVSKWASLFTIGLDTEDRISLNKRGSGIRRLILVGFFKAEAERKAKTSNKKNIIYAIEEPETSQHPDNQRRLIKAFKDLAQTDNCQVILTTHSPELAKELPSAGIRFVCRDIENKAAVKSKENKILEEVANELGLFADYIETQKIKLLICVEGPSDVIALKSFSKCLRERDSSCIDLEKDNRVIIIPLGGSTLKHWVEMNYLKKFHCKEFHIYDSDVKEYKDSVNKVNARNDGSYACLTQKYEIENYLHSKAIREEYDVDVNTDEQGVPRAFGIAYSEKHGFDGVMNDNKSKMFLSKVFEKKMSYAYLMERDKNNEIRNWFDYIKNAVEN